MNNTREIRLRIKSVENIFKITKAMQTIAASRMRRSQEKTFHARPFILRAFELLAHLGIAKFHKEEIPLFTARPVKKIAVIFISPSRGLCGGLIPNLFKKAADFIEESKKENVHLKFIVIGNKGQQFLKKMKVDIVAAFKDSDLWKADDAEPINEMVIDLFEKGEVDRVTVIYTNFISPLRQEAIVRDLLPLSEETLRKLLEAKLPQLFGRKKEVPEFKIEPTPDIAIKQLVPYMIKMGIYYLLWETKASEHASRMMAMQNARKNAEELKDDLTLAYNQMRQSAITAQVAEIIGGVAALEE